MHAPNPQTITPERRRRLIWGGGVLLGVVVIGLIGLRIAAHENLRDEAAAMAVRTVNVVAPAASAEGEELILPGSVQAATEASLYARTPGYLKRWLVDIGAPVKAGQLLAEIEAPEVDQQLVQAEADLRTAEANAELANVTAERWKNLLTTGAVSRQAADEKTSDALAKKALAASARANAQRLREIKQFTRIVAPFDGIVTSRSTDVGALIAAGGGVGPELFKVADTRQLRIYVRVPQSYAPWIKPGLKAELKFAEHPGKIYAATLARDAGALDPASRTLEIQLTADNANGELLPGGYAEVHLTLPGNSQHLRLPSNCLIFDGNGTSVAVVGPDSRIVKKPVTVGRDFGPEIEILEGVGAADKVVQNPPDTLLNGQQVKLAATAEPKP